jgi:hypothetical protein
MKKILALFARVLSRRYVLIALFAFVIGTGLSVAYRAYAYPAYPNNSPSAGCVAGYNLSYYHYDCGCTNDALWYVCTDSTLDPYH